MIETEAFHKIWDYMLLHHLLKPADMILALGAYDLRVPTWAAKLYLDGWAPLVTASGGGDISDMSGDWGKPEAQMFAEVMQNQGVPEDKILIEDKSNNTGENANLSAELWKLRGLDPKTVIAVTQPYMERRAYATLKLWWPDRQIILSTPPVSFEEWMGEHADEEQRVKNGIVGDLERIKLYPKKGFQIVQAIPEDVWSAYEYLTEQGYGRAERSGPKTRPS